MSPRGTIPLSPWCTVPEPDRPEDLVVVEAILTAARQIALAWISTY